jgi:hypothetical protein
MTEKQAKSIRTARRIIDRAIESTIKATDTVAHVVTNVVGCPAAKQCLKMYTGGRPMSSNVNSRPTPTTPPSQVPSKATAAEKSRRGKKC